MTQTTLAEVESARLKVEHALNLARRKFAALDAAAAERKELDAALCDVRFKMKRLDAAFRAWSRNVQS